MRFIRIHQPDPIFITADEAEGVDIVEGGIALGKLATEWRHPISIFTDAIGSSCPGL